MRFNLPKPLHGWREFMGQVGIIVVGVLLALSAEQIVDNLRWKYEVEAGRQMVIAELQETVDQAVEREAISACLSQRFHDIAQILDHASASGQLPAVGPIGNPNKRLWHLQSWRSLVASQTATHFPRREVLALGNLDAFLGAVHETSSTEFDHWTTLWTIVGPGRRLAVGEEAQLRQALSRAGYDAKLMRLAANQMISIIRRSDLLSGDEIAQISRETEADVRSRLKTSALCNPLGDAPAHYGSSPISLDLAAPMPAG